jgi:nitrous oxide reductase accessory protein NosL
VRLLIALAAVAACAVAGAAPAGSPATLSAESRAHNTRAQVGKLPSVKGELQLGPEHSSYVAYLQGEAVVYVDERVTGSDRRSRHRRYYFDNGALYYYEAETAAPAVGGGATATAPSVPVQVEWNSAGQAVRALRTEHYGPVKLDPQSVNAIVARAALLSKLATEQWHAAH